MAVSNGVASFDIATDASGNFVASNVVTSMDVDVSGCGALGWCSFIAQIQLDLVKEGLATNGLVNALGHLLGDPSSIDPSHSAAQIAVRDFLNSTDYEKTILPGESQRSVDVSSIRLGAIPSWPGHTGFYHTETQVLPPKAPTCTFGALSGRGVSAACGTLQDTLQVEFDNPAISVANRTAATINGGVESFAMTVLGTPSAVNVRGCQQGAAASTTDPNADPRVRTVANRFAPHVCVHERQPERRNACVLQGSVRSRPLHGACCREPRRRTPAARLSLATAGSRREQARRPSASCASAAVCPTTLSIRSGTQ